MRLSKRILDYPASDYLRLTTKIIRFAKILRGLL